ncbi:iron-containing alcohol dehydrogenase [Eubacteriales bacterium OttesenSCG-928-K08]|nr:iron-containing alcohol dehydrogenase [Eubacteriales bacterium OttesenSCG-928-K08]
MWALQKAWYRTFQFVFNYGARCLNWRKPQRVEGAGSILKIPEICAKENVKKPMIVTDPGLMKAGVALKVMAVLQDNKIPFALYDTVEPNPSVDTVNAIQALYFKEGCDGFIAIGGGSAMDAAKAAGARVVFPNRTVNQMGGLLRVWKKIPMFIAVPTTAGTGSETTIAALITDTKTHHKYAIMDLHLIPRYAVLDAQLTIGLPPHITSTTGMDALTHAIEGFLCWTYSTKESTRFAMEATKLIFENLELVYKDGSNVEARQQMQIASFKAGFAFTRAGVGNVHAIAHTLGGLYGTPHGLANAVILPIVLEDYGPAVYEKLAQLSELTGIKTDGSEEEKAKALIREIYDMNARMGIPTGFDFIQDEDVEQMITWALKECNPLYPVPVLYNRERYRRVIKKIRTQKKMTIGASCTGCTACARLCPVSAISGERGSRHVINACRCVECGVCGRACPQGCITDGKGKEIAKLARTMWPKPQIDKDVCSACGICVDICTAGALKLSLPKYQGDIDVSVELDEPKSCIGCSMCADNCPIGAIVMEKEEVQAL